MVSFERSERASIGSCRPFAGSGCHKVHGSSQTLDRKALSEKREAY